MKLDLKLKIDYNTTVTGLTEELNIFLVNELFNEKKQNVLLVADTLFEANKVYNSLKTYNPNTLLYPMDDYISHLAVAASPDLKIKRMGTIDTIIAGGRHIVVTNLNGLLKYLPKKEDQKSYKLNIKINDTYSREELINTLIKFGYERTSLVTQTGEFAVRGFIVDIFPINEDHPFRMEFEGNQLIDIRLFDENTQLKIKQTTHIIINPCDEIINNLSATIVDYIDEFCLVYWNYKQILAGYSKLSEDMKFLNQEEPIVVLKPLNDIKEKKVIYLNTYDDEAIKNTIIKNYVSQKITPFNNDFDLLQRFVKKELKNDKTVIFTLSNEKEQKEIKDLFDGNVNIDNIKKNEINVINIKTNEGFVINNYTVISEYDIDNSIIKTYNYQNKLRIGKKIKGFSDLNKGDFIVHITHGIGIYNGLVTLTKNGLQKDYIQLLYQDNDKIYIPVEKIETLYKYTIKEGSKPKINKLGTSTWEKTKRNVKRKIKDITEDLLKLYSARETIKGPAFKDDTYDETFSHSFEYTETTDQQKSINDILHDLSITKPMDRLLCGDVGYGKTEVAFRAVFRTISNGFQVAYLCPTTILAKQQYENSLVRFKDYPFNIELLSRFVSQDKIKKTVNKIADNKVDFVIGTHRLLSKDINFANLGLLIVDEEQRFGVTHKERIKELKKNVNVLTLSATPIPRTLKFALTGLRDLSIIDTPPVNRYPVQTYVIEENKMIIKEAIYNEMARQGQIYILFNNVKNIDKKLTELQLLVPEARIKVGHGQMRKEELEEVMQEFIDYKFDILLCTTIIETGMDISNVNTLIIYNADTFGLSQLYQLRGRVGRSNRIAYAYLTYEPSKMLNEISVKRLQSIKEFTELGSGYKIAMRDLALRGAGDLLGSEQAGFVNSVGIDLYMKMIEEEINGTSIEENIDKENLLDVETHIDDKYINDEEVKIEIHKIINEIDSYEKLLEIKNQIEDRFGKIDEKITIYMFEELFEKLAEQKGIENVIKSNTFVELVINEKYTSTIKGDKLLLVINNINPKILISYQKNKIHLKMYFTSLKKHYVFYLVDILENI